jgi:hypothetical protein
MARNLQTNGNPLLPLSYGVGVSITPAPHFHYSPMVLLADQFVFVIATRWPPKAVRWLRQCRWQTE